KRFSLFRAARERRLDPRHWDPDDERSPAAPPRTDPEVPTEGPEDLPREVQAEAASPGLGRVAGTEEAGHLPGRDALPLVTDLDEESAGEGGGDHGDGAGSPRRFRGIDEQVEDDLLDRLLRQRHRRSLSHALQHEPNAREGTGDLPSYLIDGPPDPG